jgi:hypothetical protein
MNGYNSKVIIDRIGPDSAQTIGTCPLLGNDEQELRDACVIENQNNVAIKCDIQEHIEQQHPE